MTARDRTQKAGDATPSAGTAVGTAADIKAVLAQLGIDPTDEILADLMEGPQGSVLPAGHLPGVTEIRVDTAPLADLLASDRCFTPRDERGAVSVWFAAASFVMIMLVGMAVDLGGKVHEQQRIRSVAAQAARTGAQEIEGSIAVRGEDLRIDINAAKAAARNYLDAAGVEGTVTVTGGDTLVVATTGTYDSKFLGIIDGLGSMTVTGKASARLIRAEGGAER